jgi:SulP family sulfate permease
VLLRSGWGDAGVLAATFFLTIFRDLTEAIIVGFALGSVLFIHRMSQATAVETHTPFVGEDMADSDQPRGGYDEAIAANPDVVIYRITGAFFFGAAASVASVLDRIQDTHKALIVDFSAVPFLDSTGAHVMEGLAHKTARRGVGLYVTGANADIRRALVTHGVRPPGVTFAATPGDALAGYRAAPGT